MDARFLNQDEYANLWASSDTFDLLPGGFSSQIAHPTLGKLTALQSDSKFLVVPGWDIERGFTEEENTECLALLDENGEKLQ